MRWSYPEGAALPIPVLSPEWAPPPLDALDLAAATNAIAALERYLAPVDPEWLAARIAAWLAHAWVPELEEAAMAMVFADWQDALERFPQWALAQAARETIGSSRRPTIAAAVDACARLVADAEAELYGLKKLVDPREQERARARRAAREAAERADAERRAFVAANPDWSPLREAMRRAIDRAAEDMSGGKDVA